MSLNNEVVLLVMKCITNHNLVRNLCKFCNYKQQYEISQASSSLISIIIDDIWRTKFEKVEIRGYGENCFIVSNIINDDGTFARNIYNLLPTSVVHLNEEERDNFLDLNSNNIKYLTIKNISNIDSGFYLTHAFNNLKYMELYNFKISNWVLEYLRDYCENIETLVLWRCFYSRRTPVLANHRNFQIISTWKNLKNLKLIKCKFAKYDFNDVLKIVNRLKLRKLTIDCLICNPKGVHLHKLQCRKLKHYKDFKIGPILNVYDRYYFQGSFSRNFQTLRNLSLSQQRLHIHFFHVLLNSCQMLRELTLFQCKIRHFVALPNLKKLELECCDGLIYHDLVVIEILMKLRFFSVVCTDITGDWNIIPISETLEILQFQSTTKAINIYPEPRMKLKQLLLDIPAQENSEINLTFAPNLTELYINLPSINIEDLLELQYLQKLFLINCTSDDLPKIQQLLKHENLTEFSILNYKANKNSLEVLRDIESVTTNLLYFNIPRTMMEHAENFVLDLLNVNTNLSLKCYLTYMRCTLYSTLIKKILLNANFPTRFKSINICGFLMDCAAIRDESVELSADLELFDDFYFILE